MGLRIRTLAAIIAIVVFPGISSADTLSRQESGILYVENILKAAESYGEISSLLQRCLPDIKLASKDELVLRLSGEKDGEKNLSLKFKQFQDMIKESYDRGAVSVSDCSDAAQRVRSSQETYNLMIDGAVRLKNQESDQGVALKD